ncbi:hypothetical protein BU23DRAFT_574076 [Bimuria novae-zelandiae CBS 107.79]|uniref:tRNA/rRNA methyltransferase SpoU type domain-containing protein n=1 Tax=Bimuria novae-zelandiae CBS 107.79 TaxID=1447943 RepID=A0A6A5UNQ8_9PLEO|nr:hypothetical protein BU23DRAFT_574076 [Bimuria novae-zelandiae CBS 107.79]
MSTSDAYHDIQSIIQFSDESTKEAARKHYWTRLEQSLSGTLDFEALRICARLLLLSAAPESVEKSVQKLQRVILDYIPAQPNNEEQLYLLAEICSSSPQLGCSVFHNIINYILAATDTSNPDGSQATHYLIRSKEENQIKLGAYYRFLKCSYWLPSDQPHHITPKLVSLLAWSIGHDGLDGYAHDTISALLTLLSNRSVVVFDDNVEALPTSWNNRDPVSGQLQIMPGVLSDTLFDRLNKLPPVYFSGHASKAFRTWFQWVSYMISNAVETQAVYSPEYWSALRIGLLDGATDQRKYCLGILQQSLALCHQSFETPDITFDVSKKEGTIKQYRKYCTLFEIIVLDRYPNQVQACLPELTALLGPASLINSAWVTALLSAALNPKIQDGVRKPVGNWYLEYATSQPGSCITHTTFLAEGFLPWASQGSLFTSTLVSTRIKTTCSHGEALAKTIARLVVAAPGNMPASKFEPCTDPKNQHSSHHPSASSSITEQQAIVHKVLSYMLGTGGKIFPPAVIFLLDGLLQGLEESPDLLLEISDIEMIAAISRLPAMPEITAELCREYCAELSRYRNPTIPETQFLPAQAFLKEASARLQDVRRQLDATQAKSAAITASNNAPDKLSTLNEFLRELHRTQHKTIQDEEFVPTSAQIIRILDTCDQNSFLPSELYQVLDTFWEEADRQDYPRPVAIRLAALFFNPTCIQTSLQQFQSDSVNQNELKATITKALTSLHRFAEGRTYLVSALGLSLRRATFADPKLVTILPIVDFFIRFVENPPVAKKEFLFEVVAAEKLGEHLSRVLSSSENGLDLISDRDYVAYYGQREWIGYAALIDLLNRIPEDQAYVAKHIMDRLLEPWRTQKAPIPIISKFKNVFQLQIMLLLTESSVTKENADWYLDSFMHALILEPWPRYRFILEWIIARIYFHFPSKTHRILDDLARLDENSPVHIASLMKLALLTAPFLDSEDFALRLMVQLIPFSASPKVHIRHEAHWCFPTIFYLARERNWSSITDNPAFVALDKHIRSLEKFSAVPSTIRTLKLDAVKDFTLTKIFQGQYLRLETPDMQYVAHEDFIALYDLQPHTDGSHASPPRVPLGDPLPAIAFTTPPSEWKKSTPAPAPKQAQTSNTTPTFFQTKSGFDIASLLHTSGPPSAQHQRPASVILIASLIDNPTNLGGLSRIAESFGLEALYIDDLKKTAHKDFKATSVTSEKHFPIRELKAFQLPAWLVEQKREGWIVVGIEQTDRSGILGEGAVGDVQKDGYSIVLDGGEGGKATGTLPKKCILVLGAERSGITSEVLAVVDRCVEIRTVGVTRSLNVQTAGGIAVYEWWREWGGKV